MQTVSATDLARNTREVLDKVAGRGETLAVERNRRIIAEIVPPARTMTAAQVLSGLKPMLTGKQAAAWLQDAKGGFDEVVSNPWE